MKSGRSDRYKFMGKLFILIGKSASGKDSIYKRLIEDPSLGLRPYVGYTTRPIRSGEQDGREYYFVSPEELEEIEASGKLIEKRVYHTVHGDWCYFSVDSDSFRQGSGDYLYIGTLESYLPLRDHYGADQVVPLYIEIEDGLRLQRALDRERSQEIPRYAELCRRFLVDEQDFSEEKLKEAGILQRFNNQDLEECCRELHAYISA